MSKSDQPAIASFEIKAPCGFYERLASMVRDKHFTLRIGDEPVFTCSAPSESRPLAAFIEDK